MSSNNPKLKGICAKCNSRNYCPNREDGVRACADYNKYPSEKDLHNR